MKNIQTLEIHADDTAFLNEIDEKHPFNMPKLKQLTLRRRFNDKCIIKFINCFKKIVTLDVLDNGGVIASNIEHFGNIRKLVIDHRAIKDLESFLEKVDKSNKKLNQIKVVHIFDKYDKENFENQLKQMKKQTWKATYVKEYGFNAGFMFLQRK